MKLNGIKLTWLGHSTFLMETPRGKKILVDPWVNGNPATPARWKNFDKIDVMLCTHGHGEHIGDAVALINPHNPQAVGIYELGMWLKQKRPQQIAHMKQG